MGKGWCGLEDVGNSRSPVASRGSISTDLILCGFIGIWWAMQYY
jgi:hypothetical protein